MPEAYIQPLDSRALTVDITGRRAVRSVETIGVETDEIFKFGFNAAVPSTNYEELWTPSVAKNWLNVDSEFFLASREPLDTSREVIVEVINSSHEQFTIVATTDPLNGQTPVSLGNFVSVQRMRRKSPSTGELWVGTGSFLSGQPATDDQRQGHIPAGQGASFHGFYTIPQKVGHTEYSLGVLRWCMPMATGSAYASFEVKIPGLPWWEMDLQTFNGSGNKVDFHPGMTQQPGGYSFVPGTSFRYRAKAGTGVVVASGRFNVALIETEQPMVTG